MLTVNSNQHAEDIVLAYTPSPPPKTIEIHLESRLRKLLTDLSPEVPWGDRQIAARKIGYLRDSQAVPGLLSALLIDPFWMVRCTIIQALEMIGDRSAVQPLEEVARNDSYQVVRSYAAKAAERLSKSG